MWILLIAAAVVALGVIVIYNGLVRLRLQCDNAWADIDVQLTRRHDLIPNAVVRDLNSRIAQFPSNLIAGMFGFAPRQFYELTSAAEQEVPQIRLTP